MLFGALEGEQRMSVARPPMVSDHVTQEEEAVRDAETVPSQSHVAVINITTAVGFLRVFPLLLEVDNFARMSEIRKLVLCRDIDSSR